MQILGSHVVLLAAYRQVQLHQMQEWCIRALHNQAWSWFIHYHHVPLVIGLVNLSSCKMLLHYHFLFSPHCHFMVHFQEITKVALNSFEAALTIGTVAGSAWTILYDMCAVRLHSCHISDCGWWYYIIFVLHVITFQFMVIVSQLGWAYCIVVLLECASPLWLWYYSIFLF